MAQLKDLIVNGASQLIGNVYTSQIQISKLNALTDVSATTYGAGSAGQVLMSNGTNTYWGTPAATVTESTVSGWGFTKNAGTVTSVRVQATAPIISSSNTAQTGSLNTTISLAKTTANYVLAGPSSGTTTAIPTYRKLVAADIPSLTKSKISDFPTSMPASDVSDWAKAPTKPSYSITEISGAGNAKIFYGTCSTAAATTAKTVTCADFTSADLVKGALIYVTFDNSNTGAVGSLTMSVNGTTAKYIKHLRNGGLSNLAGAGHLCANETYLFTYDGTYWVTDLEYNTDSNTLQRTYRSSTNVELPIAAISTTASSTAAYSAISSGGSKDVYAAIPNTDANRVMFNPSTGLITFGQNGLKTSKIQAPTAAGGTTYGAGSSGQALMSNGSTVYWGNVSTTLKFTNKTVAAGTSGWTGNDTTYSGFPYKANITCNGVTANHIPNIIFDYNELISGNFCPFADSGTNTVTIYCKTQPSETITIPTIYCV